MSTAFLGILSIHARPPFTYAALDDDRRVVAQEQLPDKDVLIYLYCRSGARSRTGALQLIKLGYTNLYDLGGIISWPYEVE